LERWDPLSAPMAGQRSAIFGKKLSTDPESNPAMISAIETQRFGGSCGRRFADLVKSARLAADMFSRC
jgi:hypothetical protein